MAKKKKQSRLKRVISALNPTNPKGMALLFGLIFAFSGAGAYLYQSFASSLSNPYSCPAPQPEIKRGSSGNCVKYLQWQFNTYAYRKKQLAENGLFDQKIEDTVKAFQYVNKIGIDGVVGPITWSRVNGLSRPQLRSGNFVGHFEDTYWQGLNNQYTDMSVDIIPQQATISNQEGFFYALSAFYVGDNSPVYTGLQTQGTNGTSFVGKMAIFSVWNVTSGIAEPGGWAVPFSGEGVGFSTRIRYNWTIGHTYRFKMYIDTFDNGNGKRIWAASVTDQNTNITTRIGRIYVPIAKGFIYQPVTFDERYMGPNQRCSDVTPNRVTFQDLKATSIFRRVESSTYWDHAFQNRVAQCGANFLTTRDTTTGYSVNINQ